MKFTGDSYLKYCPMLIFWNFKVDYSYCPNLNLKTDFLAYELVNLKNQIVTSLWNVNLNANELMNTKMTFSWNHKYLSPHLGIFSTWSAGSNFFYSFLYLVKLDKNNDHKTKKLSLVNIAIRYILVNGEGRRESGILFYPHFIKIWNFPQKIEVIWNGSIWLLLIQSVSNDGSSSG